MKTKIEIEVSKCRLFSIIDESLSEIGGVAPKQIVILSQASISGHSNAITTVSSIWTYTFTSNTKKQACYKDLTLGMAQSNLLTLSLVIEETLLFDNFISIYGFINYFYQKLETKGLHFYWAML